MAFCDSNPNDAACQAEAAAQAASANAAGIVFKPAFAAHDLTNLFEIAPHSELNSDLGGR